MLLTFFFLLFALLLLLLILLLLCFADTDQLVSFQLEALDAEDVMTRFDRLSFVAGLLLAHVLLLRVLELELLTKLLDPIEANKTDIENGVESDKVD